MTALGTAIAERLFPEQSASARDPVGWVESRLGERLWSKQREILESVVAHRHTAVRSGHGVGKSYTASRAVAHWLDVHPVGEAFAVTTAPTGDQINAILWRELDQAHARGRLRGEITGTVSTRRWHINGQLVALGRKSQDFIDPERAAAAFQGIHAPFVLVVIDEASGVQPWLWEAVDALTTNEAARVLAIGNPLDPTSRFAEVCKPGSGWNSLRVSVLDTPAFTGERAAPELLERLPSRVWVEERKRRWGEESPLYVARVLGEFPEAAEDTLISPTLVAAAQARELVASRPVRFGVDPARSGSDETAVYANRGGVLRLVHRAQGHDLMRTAGEVARRLPEEGPDSSAVIDVVGLGAGVYDRLREQSANVIAFQGSARPSRPDRFANRRAEAFWDLREAFREGQVDIDPADDELAAQLCAIRWKVDSRGLILIESKDDMRKRGLPSPDRADSVAMALTGSRQAAGWEAWKRLFGDPAEELAWQRAPDGSVMAGVLDEPM